ncbi:DUF1501 domain-containing protein [soil metagenome]
MTDSTDFGCSDFGMTRRSILKTAGVATMAGVVTSMFGDVLTSTVYGADNGNVLVVLSLRGGADGLSMVVPHHEAAYYSARPGTAVKKGELLKADSYFGLHPKFAAMLPLWNAKKFAVINSVGLPAPNRSHFEAMEIVEDADPGSSARVGWINRMVGGLAPANDPFEALQLGSALTPTSMFGPAPTLSANNFSDLSLPWADDARMHGRLVKGLKLQYGKRTDTLGHAAMNAMKVSDRSNVFATAAKKGPANGATYPKGELASALKNAAAAIKTGSGVKAVAVDFGSWDHHTGLNWNVANQIEQLSLNVAAFFTDLGAHADRVTLVTLSEFGRRLQENGAHGVDHGYGSAVLVAGAGLKSSGYYGTWPGLGLPKQVDGDLAVTTDYRNVIAEILRRRFPLVNTSKVFPGVTYKPVGFMA